MISDKLTYVDAELSGDTGEFDEAVDREMEEYAAKFKRVTDACEEDIKEPYILLIKSKIGLHYWDSILENGNVEDLKQMLAMFSVVVADKIEQAEGGDAATLFFAELFRAI